MEEPGENRATAAELRLTGLPEDAGVHGGDAVHGGHRWGSVRIAHHRGHEIRIETMYRVTVDGKDLEGALEVLDDGSVHCHGLPQYAVPSAIEMVKLVIDHLGVEPPAHDELGEVTP